MSFGRKIAEILARKILLEAQFSLKQSELVSIAGENIGEQSESIRFIIKTTNPNG